MPPVVPGRRAGLVRAERRTRRDRSWAKMMARRKGRADMAKGFAAARALFRGDSDPATPCFTIWIDALHSRARQKGHKVPSPSSHPLTSVGVSPLKTAEIFGQSKPENCVARRLWCQRKSAPSGGGRVAKLWKRRTRGKSSEMSKLGSE